MNIERMERLAGTLSTAKPESFSMLDYFNAKDSDGTVDFYYDWKKRK